MLMRVHHPRQVNSTAESHATTESVAFNFWEHKHACSFQAASFALHFNKDIENFLQKILFELSEEKHSDTTANKALIIYFKNHSTW